MAKAKLSEAPDTEYILSDFNGFEFPKKYNAVVSSLSLHHLETDREKLGFYKKIYSCLKEGGVFVNADVVLGSTDALQELYMDKWRSFMYGSVGRDETEGKWIPKYYEEDRRVSLTEHLKMLKEAGFTAIDVVWKYYNYAVYTAVK